ncbi:hypothetical protein Tco_0209738 [Tanacetum coccineum]
MENSNPPPSDNRHVLPAALRARINHELHELKVISAFVDSRLVSIEQLLNNFASQPNETNMNNLESDDESRETPLVSSFPHSDNDSDDEEVLKELSKYENTGTLCRERIINSFDGDDLAFECMIGFRKFTAYVNPFLPMNIISRKAYNTIMVEGLEGTGKNLVAIVKDVYEKNLVAIVKDVYVFIGSFTYITDFVVLEEIGEFIMSDMAEVLMGRPCRKITKLKYDVVKGLVLFTKIFDTYTYRMPRTIPRLKNFNWSKVSPLLELSKNDLMNVLRHPYEKNKFMYKNCLNLGPEYQVDESMKEWLIRVHVRSRGSDFDIPVVFSLIIALLRNKLLHSIIYICSLGFVSSAALSFPAAVTVVMSADSAVTYTSVNSEARSWSIPSEDPYEEAARQLLEQAPRSPEWAFPLPTLHYQSFLVLTQVQSNYSLQSLPIEQAIYIPSI